MNDIKIDAWMETIRKVAYVAYNRMKKPSIYSFEDMVQEGIVVFFSDVLPHYSPTGKAAFKSYLVTCLRNHYCGMMKKSFHDHDPSSIYHRLPPRHRSRLSPSDHVIFKMTVSDLVDKLDELQIQYLQMLMGGGIRKDIRRKMQISKPKERNIRRVIAQKILISGFRVD